MGEGNQIGEKKSFIDKYAKILVIVAVLCGATSGNFGVLITASPTVIGFWRLAIALPFFAIPIFSNADKRKQLAQVSKKELLLSFISGAFLFLHYFTWYSSVKLTNVASAAVLASFHPLVVIFITVFIYKKRISWKSILAILVALGGGILYVPTFRRFQAESCQVTSWHLRPESAWVCTSQSAARSDSRWKEAFMLCWCLHRAGFALHFRISFRELRLQAIRRWTMFTSFVWLSSARLAHMRYSTFAWVM